MTLVLLIACANVANLLLARATERKHEIAVRAAVGADRGRIVRQLLTESVLLSTTGGVVGLGIGIVGIRALLTVNTAGLPRIGDGGSLVGTDWRVVLFTLAATVITAMIFGLIPALHSSRVDLSGNLKEAGGRSGSCFRQNKARSLLVVVEVALAVVLVVGSALLIRTSISLADVDPGFDPTNVLIARTSLTGPRFQTSAGVELAIRNVSERLSSLPGVESASATCCVPLQGGFGLPFSVLGRTAEGSSEGGAGWITVSPDFFEVFSIPVKSGRAFDERDNGSAPGVVVINEAMARQFWPDGDPLQDRIAIGRGVMRELDGDPERQIIGVVGDTRNGALGRDPTPAMYVPQAQLTDAANALNLRLAPTAWLVRTRAQTQSFNQTIQDEIRQISGLPVSDVRPMDDVVLQSVSRQRFNMWLMVVFGSSAVLLAAIGIYGLMSYSVKQRLQEIGIRLALGARTGKIRNMVVFQGMLLALAGIAIGMGGAFGLTRFIESLLFGVETQDPIVFIATPVLLLVIAFLAVWLPASRAGGVNPLDALRYD